MFQAYRGSKMNLIQKSLKFSYFENHELVESGGKSNPNSGGMLEPNFSTSSLRTVELQQ